jgi:hypothetical protein
MADSSPADEDGWDSNADEEEKKTKLNQGACAVQELIDTEFSHSAPTVAFERRVCCASVDGTSFQSARGEWTCSKEKDIVLAKGRPCVCGASNMLILVRMTNVLNGNVVFVGSTCLLHLGDATIRAEIRANWRAWVFIMGHLKHAVKSCGMAGTGTERATFSEAYEVSLAKATERAEAARQRAVAAFAAKAKWEGRARAKAQTTLEEAEALQPQEDADAAAKLWRDNAMAAIVAEEEEQRKDKQEVQRKDKQEAHRKDKQEAAKRKWKTERETEDSQREVKRQWYQNTLRLHDEERTKKGYRSSWDTAVTYTATQPPLEKPDPVFVARLRAEQVAFASVVRTPEPEEATRQHTTERQTADRPRLATAHDSAERQRLGEVEIERKQTTKREMAARQPWAAAHTSMVEADRQRLAEVEIERQRRALHLANCWHGFKQPGP